MADRLRLHFALESRIVSASLRALLLLLLMRIDAGHSGSSQVRYLPDSQTLVDKVRLPRVVQASLLIINNKNIPLS